MSLVYIGWRTYGLFTHAQSYPGSQETQIVQEAEEEEGECRGPPALWVLQAWLQS